MKVLGYVHTYNDADVIDATIQALCDQTYPLPEILLIDNASTDDTLDRGFPRKVTIIRNNQNLGTSGAVAAGMAYALEHGYDWIYILDADSTPAPDAVENLLRCYDNLSPELRSSTWWLSSLLKEAGQEDCHHGCLFTPHGIEYLNPPPMPVHHPCHSNMWSGSLYRLDAVKDVGLPDPNYVLDWGDIIYGYEGMQRGYTGFLDQSSIVEHHQHPFATLHFRRLISRFVRVFYMAPPRAYYFWRNSAYFWVYRYNSEIRGKLIMSHFFLYLRSLIKVSLFIKAPGPILWASLRGMRDGLQARLENRY
jgi:GT2 family glycosyltransferase